MKKIFIMCVLLLCSVVAQAQTITIKNTTAKQGYAAFYYYNTKNTWMSKGWFVINPNSETIVDLDSVNQTFYIHVDWNDETSVGTLQTNDTVQWVALESFEMPMGVKPTNGFLAGFMKCPSDGNTATVTLK